MGFAEDLRALCERAGNKAEMVVRGAALELASQMVNRSPVGNPDLWKGNAGVMAAREAYREEAFAYNAANPGKRKKGVSRRTVNKKFPLKAGKGYTGGRFKGNWIAATGSAMDKSTTDATDPSGRATLAAIKQKLGGWRPGQTIWVTNSLPYAKKLEFGHSKQAPTGIVRLAVQNYAQALAKAAAEVRGK